jgi:hypothetical protein
MDSTLPPPPPRPRPRSLPHSSSSLSTLTVAAAARLQSDTDEALRKFTRVWVAQHGANAREHAPMIDTHTHVQGAAAVRDPGPRTPGVPERCWKRQLRSPSRSRTWEPIVSARAHVLRIVHSSAKKITNLTHGASALPRPPRQKVSWLGKSRVGHVATRRCRFSAFSDPTVCQAAIRFVAHLLAYDP